jgi:hypothetical protein
LINFSDQRLTISCSWLNHWQPRDLWRCGQTVPPGWSCTMAGEAAEYGGSAALGDISIDVCASGGDRRNLWCAVRLLKLALLWVLQWRYIWHYSTCACVAICELLICQPVRHFVSAGMAWFTIM